MDPLKALDQQIQAARVGDDKFSLADALQSVYDALAKGAAIVKAVDQATKTPETVPQPK